jgi:cytochrome c biogenesis protein CcmG/thiol:disulfide interchange protein DsbE
MNLVRLRWFLWGVVGIAAALIGLFAYQLGQPKDDFVASAMVGQPMPDFSLPPASASRPGLARADLADGKPKLLNIWASWCLPCAAEAPQLDALERSGATIMGIAIRDREADVDRFLAAHGNPFARIGRDDISEVQLALGSSGVPETFVIDGEGRITYQHIGDIRPEHVATILEELRKAGA